MTFLPDRPPHLGGLPRLQHPDDITDFPKPLGYRCGHGLAFWPHAKSRQGLPRRLVPLRLRRGTVSSGARTQPVLALIWTHAIFNEAVGALPVCRANDPRSS